MKSELNYKITGLVFLVVGILFFLRDIGINYVGHTNALTLLLVLVGAGLLAGGAGLTMSKAASSPKSSKKG